MKRKQNPLIPERKKVGLYILELHSQEGDQLMSSPPFRLISSWMRCFKNEHSLFSPPIKKEICTEEELLNIYMVISF